MSAYPANYIWKMVALSPFRAAQELEHKRDAFHILRRALSLRGTGALPHLLGKWKQPGMELGFARILLLLREQIRSIGNLVQLSTFNSPCFIGADVRECTKKAL